MMANWLSMLFIALVMALVLLGFADPAYAAVDLREYMPANGQLVYANDNGQLAARFTFFKNGNQCKRFTKKKGQCVGWRKEYRPAGKWLQATTGLMHYGDDGSLGECGDKRPAHRDGGETIFYQRGNQFDCLPFANAGGLDFSWTNKTMAVKGTSDAVKSQRVFLMSRLVEVMPECTLQGGNRKTYRDCIRIIVLHGSTEKRMASCNGEPLWQAGPVQYRKIAGYNTNAMEYVLAKGVGIIEKLTPYVENEPGHRGHDECQGYMFNAASFHLYLAN